MNLVNYLILNDFSEFLDKNNYFKKDNNIYLNLKSDKYGSIHFLHKDPFNNESEFLYTVRCVNRFNNLKNDIRCKLFFYTIYDNNYSKDELSELNNTLQIKFSNNYKIILVNYLNNDENKEYDIIYDNIVLLNIYKI